MTNFTLRRMFGNRRTIVTYTFLAIQIIAFLLMTINGGSTNIYTLINFGAKFNPAILAGELWRLVTPIFLHIGFMHILLNSITLYFLGTQLELIYGNFRFALIYLLGGLMGNVVSFAFSEAVSAGASTSLFGLFATAVVLGRLYPNNYAIRNMAQGFMLLIILNFVNGLASPSIDNWGHLGGAIGGGLATMFISVPGMVAVDRGTRIKTFLSYVILAVSLILFGFIRNGMIY
ncbi:rhomboid family intramembrane serine protease [Jeotgalibaca caeni]|uniref:rhomboid family intramembrane serine protease n=1 Tax=Jeotgalibaca caeni TaxID=3028623 RepID=UPI00237E059E|nr:rhomboid family intramembrane serine protease [Jeotgalibaca caeni]MDE1549732.1 rhomboid family intramembrane serine protease [Jeotgalibaca caeni]